VIDGFFGFSYSLCLEFWHFYPPMKQAENLRWGLVLGLFVLGYLLNLGLQPLYLEEPRRVIVAMEMVFNGNWWVPTQFGEPYYNKPPLFNWLLNGSAWLHGGYSEWAMRLPTVLANWGMGGLVFFSVRRYLNREAAWLTLFFFFSCSGLLFYFSMLAEIDLFYSLLTLAGLLAIFHFEQQERYLLLFLLAYGLGALGFLTKGIPSLLFTGITLVAWLAYRGKWRLLFSGYHVLGMLGFAFLVCGYYFIYSQYQDILPFLTRQFTESSDRLLVENPFVRLLTHLVTFPLHILKDLLPGTLLLIYAFRKDLWTLLRQNDLIAFALIITPINLLPYWISPAARLRYIYMLYPFFLMVWIYAWQHRATLPDNWRDKLLRGLLLTAHLLLPLAALAFLWLEDMQFLPHLEVLSIGFALLFGLLAWFQFRRPSWQWPLFFAALALARIFFDLTVLPQRTHDSNAQVERDAAREIARLVPAQDTIRVLKDTLVSYILLVYLNEERDIPIIKSPEDRSDQYYLLHGSEVRPTDRIIYEVHEGPGRIGLRPPKQASSFAKPIEPEQNRR